MENNRKKQKRENLIKKLESSQEKFKWIYKEEWDFEKKVNSLAYRGGIDPFDKDDKPSQSNFRYFDEQWNK